MIKKSLKCRKEEIIDLVAIYFDKTSSINISKNLVMHTKKKHIVIKYHYFRELVQDKEVKLEYVYNKEKIIDISTINPYLKMLMTILEAN